MATSGVEQQLLRLIGNTLPAVDTAGFCFEPIAGLSGERWRIRAQGIDWLARPHTAQSAQIGAHQRREYRLLRRMSGCRLAPRPVLWRDGWLIVEWVAGRTATQDEFLQRIDDGALAQCLSQVHQQARCGYPLGLAALLARHWQNMSPYRRSPALLRRHRHFQRCRQPTPLACAPLHLDVHADNLLVTERSLMLIDWEYAADGDIGLELALVWRGNGLSHARRQRLLYAYQRLRPEYTLSMLQRSVEQWRPWVDYLMLMWFEVRWRQTRQEAFLHAAAPLRCQMGLTE